jgi:hypothetical protein
MPTPPDPVKREARILRNLTAEHARRIKLIFAAHIADAALRSDKAQISALRSLQGSLVAAIKADEFETGA